MSPFLDLEIGGGCQISGNPLSLTNKTQHYTIFFIAVNAVGVSVGFSAHHQELKLYTQHLVYVQIATVMPV